MVRKTLRRHPTTIVLVALTLVGAVLGRGFLGPTSSVSFALGTGYEQVVGFHRWWTPLTSAFLTDGGLDLPLVIIAMVVVVGAAERLMGSRRTAIAFVTTALAGVVVGVVVQSVGSALGELWSRRVSEIVTLDPMTAIAGTIMTASAFAGPLWRRRIRVVTGSIVLMFLLYAGDPSDLYRSLATLAGLGLGVALHPTDGPLRWQRSSHREMRVLLAAVVAITAIGPAITVFSRVRLGALAPLGLLLTDARPGGVSTVDECRALAITHACLHDMTLERISGVGPVLLTILPMLTLLVAALGLLRGRRFGAWLAIGVNVTLAALAAYFYGLLPLVGDPVRVHGTHYWEVTISLTASVLLPLAIALFVLANLRHLRLRASRETAVRYILTVAIALVGLSLLYVGGGWLLSSRFHPRVGLADLLLDLPERFVPIGLLKVDRLAFLPTDTATHFLYYWIGPVFWLTVVVGALLVVLRARTADDVAGSARIRSLLTGVGGGSLSYWATWPGNSYWFSRSGEAGVAYRVIGDVAITSSEPIGAPDAALAAIEEFATFCDDNGWTPVFYSIHERYLAECERLGWSSMGVGDETVVLPQQWKTTGKRWQDVRSSINRAERAGVRAVWTTYPSLSVAHAAQIGEISEAWVAEKELPEMGFTLGGMDELHDPAVGLMLACDADDRVVAVTSWLPTYRDGRIVGWTLDFMRRAPDGMNGIMEFVIARAAEQFRDDGIEFMSLSAAPLAHGGVEVEQSAAARTLAFVGARLEPVYGFRSLFAFKRKFQPEFRPLAMAYPDPLALPAIGLALARAYVPSLSVRGGIRFLRSLGPASAPAPVPAAPPALAPETIDPRPAPGPAVAVPEPNSAAHGATRGTDPAPAPSETQESVPVKT
ncbi:DUF2156 domain-containing protein [Lacisediminihabitans changchengi]|uniref:DUF2156 domain-containing protein n=1 Tax=Lacisediminihabitans changchengi TaxID=2787634 RepID=A0A934SR32_9MICO|nr:DUF2156 domain-containing protein [Lacisediminihabitans changchengi]MBK4346604.1 DUF2156 domain-containing protein [Lacisediminihabitans changchengi]